MVDNRIYTITNQLVDDAYRKKQRKIVAEIYDDIPTKPPIKILRGKKGTGKFFTLFGLLVVLPIPWIFRSR